MKLDPLALHGAYLLRGVEQRDERGFFARTFDAGLLRRAGLPARILQSSLSHNPTKGTLRGLHYQAPPHEEVKLVRCVRGKAYDVLVDLRPRSPTYLRWTATELAASRPETLYVPKGVAHGFLTLEANTDLFYEMMQTFQAASARGVRWDDPGLAIRWPSKPRLISERDRTHPDHTP